MIFLFKKLLGKAGNRLQSEVDVVCEKKKRRRGFLKRWMGRMAQDKSTCKKTGGFFTH